MTAAAKKINDIASDDGKPRRRRLNILSPESRRIVRKAMKRPPTTKAEKDRWEKRMKKLRAIMPKNGTDSTPFIRKMRRGELGPDD